MRLAVIDIGTNSIHMVIVEASGPGGFDVVDHEREVVQVGRGSFESGRLRPDAIHRTVDSLARFVQLARRHQVDRILCTATAAVREAQGSIHALAKAAHWQDAGSRIAHLNGHVLTLESLERLTQRLQAMTRRAREGLRAIGARRAEIIVAGAITLQHVLEELGLDGITISNFGVREGIVSDFFTRHAGEISPPP